VYISIIDYRPRIQTAPPVCAVCLFLMAVRIPSRSSSIYTHCTHPFLIGFCVCVLSFLVCCFANVAIDRRHDRPILPSYTRLVRMSILCDGPPFVKHSVACSTTTVTKCQAGLRTLQAFPVFHPTCLCREPSVDPDCNAFRDSLFDHPCMVATQKGRLYNLFFLNPLLLLYTVEIRNKIKWRKSYLSVQIILFRVARRLSNPTQQKKKLTIGKQCLDIL
jgi:hypothetical protein